MACRYSTSSIHSSSAAPLHNRFRDSISSITLDQSNAFSCYHSDTLDQSSCCQGYQDDVESFGGHHGDHQYTQTGQQFDWSLSNDLQARNGSGSGVGGFEPHEVVLLAYNQCVVIHAEKTGADGSVALPISLCCRPTWTRYQ